MSASVHNQVIDLLGGQTAVARRLNIKPPSVNGWRDSEGVFHIPRLRLIELAPLAEAESRGAITRRALFPDDAHLIWPDLAVSEPNQAPAPAESAQAAIKTEVKEGANA